MPQIVLIEDNKNLNDLISINLNAYLGVDLIQQNNAADTLGLLTILPNVDLIITKDKVLNEETARIIEKYINDKNLDTTIIVLGKLRQPGPNTICVEDPREWEKIVQITAQILGLNTNDVFKNIKPEYIPMPVKYFLNLDYSCSDVFIRIRKSPTEFQFIKRIHKGDPYLKESIHRYLEQGLEYFFVPESEQKQFSIFLSNKLVEKMENPNHNLATRIQLMGDSYEVATKEIIRLGFNSETIQLTESIIANMIKNFTLDNEMANLLHKVINSKTGNLFQRCHMISIVANECMRNLKIKDMSIYEKIAFASFFHDILFLDKEQLSKINSQKELDEADLSEGDWDLVFTHALETAQFIQRHPEIPYGIDEIIKHHHGSSSGKGFSESIDTLPDVSQIFIIAHQFVHQLFAFKEGGGRPSPIVDELFKKYTAPEAIIIIKSLEKTLKKKKN